MNHPNIAAIYHLEEVDGVCYLILEYVPGQTLDQRLKSGALKFREALSIALQIAEALSAAHESGVIHRDLKPANVCITPDGGAKVLDFGLAKAFGRERPHTSSGVTTTQIGQLVGTPAYMSPEQARGQSTDHRTDIWSFGCLLYEMVNGRLPFTGQTVTDLLASILTDEPDWKVLPPEVPKDIRQLLRRCLATEPKDRPRTMGEALRTLATR